MRIILGSMIAFCMIITTGCGLYQAPIVPPGGLLFANIKAPIDIDTEKTELGTKTGEASTVAVLWLFSFGDCSINAAARNGNLQTINHVDYGYTNILGLYQCFTTIVYGD